MLSGGNIAPLAVRGKPRGTRNEIIQTAAARVGGRRAQARQARQRPAGRDPARQAGCAIYTPDRICTCEPDRVLKDMHGRELVRVVGAGPYARVPSRFWGATGHRSSRTRSPPHGDCKRPQPQDAMNAQATDITEGRTTGARAGSRCQRGVPVFPCCLEADGTDGSNSGLPEVRQRRPTLASNGFKDADHRPRSEIKRSDGGTLGPTQSPASRPGRRAA
jgi:hypothetical protein